MTQTGTNRWPAVATAVVAMAALTGCTGAAGAQGIVLEDVTSDPDPVVATSPPARATSPRQNDSLTSRPETTSDPATTASPEHVDTPIDATKAREVALAQVGSGTVLYVEQEHDEGRLDFDVHIRDADDIWWEVTVDAASGQVVDMQREDDADLVVGTTPFAQDDVATTSGNSKPQRRPATGQEARPSSDDADARDNSDDAPGQDDDGGEAEDEPEGGDDAADGDDREDEEDDDDGDN